MLVDAPRLMPKYRIVKRPDAGTYCYFAQEKWLWGWVDLPQHSVSGRDEYPRGAETPSHSQELVENYIEHIARKQKDIVVKEYD
jgi:hypothetical protein